MSTPSSDLLGLSGLLASHRPSDAREAADLLRMREALGALATPLSRHQEEAHFTASAVVVNRAGDAVALVHHGKLDRWLQPGGHVEPADGGDLLCAALREAREETGCDVALDARGPIPLDVDAHVIPARGSEPAHTHLDVRFLLVTDAPEQLRHDPEESHAARWFGWDEALSLAGDPALRRLLTKARAGCLEAARMTGTDDD